MLHCFIFFYLESNVIMQNCVILFVDLIKLILAAKLISDWHKMCWNVLETQWQIHRHARCSMGNRLCIPNRAETISWLVNLQLIYLVIFQA